MIIRAAERFRTAQPGIESWHVLSAGPHYDPARLRFGPLIGLDEHVLAPGAGFAEHAHRGVTIVSWVARGVLEHRGDTRQTVRPGEVLVQRAGRGIRHEERNPSADEPLVLVQATVLAASDEAPATERTEPPVDLGALRFGTEPAAPAYVYVLSGAWSGLTPGDFAFVEQAPRGEGALLAWVPSGS